MIGPLFCFYGDDFTGSTDALEALASQGVETVLFPKPPDAALLARFADCRAIGIAGESRSRGPEWMDAQLPPVFENLRQYGAPLCQYKVCSTFDSSPQFGSIGRAMEIGRGVFGNRWVPIAVAAPHLKRYVLFGNLFAFGGGSIHRIDRHPAMSRHPVTPMDEADLRLHLARQTAMRIGLVDIQALEQGRADDVLALQVAENEAVLFDGLGWESIAEVGRLVWEQAEGFCVGSSGLTHALMMHWRAVGLVARDFEPPQATPVEKIIVVSGSCSPATATQIEWAGHNGYAAIRVDVNSFDMERDLSSALAGVENHRGVVLYSALGPADRRGEPKGESLGRYLGSLLAELIRRSGVRRAVVAGGDTSSHAVAQLDIDALTFAALLSPGAPLCRVHSLEPEMDGVELVLKGGQVGPAHFFENVRQGIAE